MNDSESKISELQQRLDQLVRTQIGFQQEITRISEELRKLRAESVQRQPQRPHYVPPSRPQTPDQQPGSSPHSARQDAAAQPQPGFQRPRSDRVPPPTDSERARPANETANEANAGSGGLESFIGENLFSKVGVIVLIIGVAIGAKYAIDRELISPLARIVLGYLSGAALLGLALWLKPRFLNFSAALMSGAVAILYFITYFAYDLYQLMPMPAAFGLMAVFTVLAVAAAVWYKRQFIAHVGLVGAYAVPFFLDNQSGNYAAFFGYIAVINIGVLAVSVYRYWRLLMYNAFLTTWFIYAVWFFDAYKPEAHFELAFGVAAAFFTIFYVTFVIYKIVTEENLAIENAALVLSNSFVFFGFGSAALNSSPGFADKIGMFAVINAAIHFVAALIFSRIRSVPHDLTLLCVVLIVTFVTIAVPIQLDGNWILLVWTIEAVMLFAIGRAKQIAIFEQLSYPLMTLSAAALTLEWSRHAIRPIMSFAPEEHSVFLNGTFAAGLIFGLGASILYWIQANEDYETVRGENSRNGFAVLFAATAMIVLYNTFRTEIADFFLSEMARTAKPANLPGRSNSLLFNAALENSSVAWQLLFTMVCVSSASLINMSKWRSTVIAAGNIFATVLVTIVFVTIGLYALSEPVDGMFPWSPPSYYALTGFNSGIRYLSFFFLGGMVICLYLLLRQEFAEQLLNAGGRVLLTDFLSFGALLLIGSSEVFHQGRALQIADIGRFGLSIFWGIFALGLIAFGIAVARRHIRIWGFAIFGITLAKVFIYDSSGIGTIPKMLVFVALGALLLVASFLYNKYKSIIFGDE